MSKSLSLTRRQMARLILAGTASALLMTPNAPANADNIPTPAPTLNEGTALADAVPGAAGYEPTEGQSREAMAALKGYPGALDKARAFPLANSIEPAFVPYAPPAPAKKERPR